MNSRRKSRSNEIKKPKLNTFLLFYSPFSSLQLHGADPRSLGNPNSSFASHSLLLSFSLFHQLQVTLTSLSVFTNVHHFNKSAFVSFSIVFISLFLLCFEFVFHLVTFFAKLFHSILGVMFLLFVLCLVRTKILNHHRFFFYDWCFFYFLFWRRLD